MNPDRATLPTPYRGLLSRVRFAFALLGVIVAIGCGEKGEPLYPASGEVTFKEEPLAEGTIAFVPHDGRSPHATQITEGKYKIKLPAGTHKVVIEASRFIGPEDKVMGLRPREQYLPDKYNVDSTLEADVKPDHENDFSFHLKE